MPDIVVRLLPIAAAVVLIFYMLHLLRSHRIRERYVYLWLLLGLALLVLSLWPQLAFYLASFLGFQTPANLLLTACSLLLLVSAITLSVTVSSLEEDRRRLVEEIALLDLRVRNLEDQAMDSDDQNLPK